MNKEQGKQPTIFLIEEDDETRRLLAQNLRKNGYRIIISVDEEDALERVSGGHVHADVVLVNLVGKSLDELLTAGRSIRKHAKSNGNTPLVVMPEKYGKNVEGTEDNIEGSDWVFYLGEEPNQLQNFLARLLLTQNAI